MANLLWYKLRPWQQSDSKLPSELDRDVLHIFAALFEKSGSPGHYLHQLQQFYQASRDFRLLAVMVDAVVGHTPQKVYPLLQAMQPILSEIRDEAAVDELAAQLEKTRARAKSTIDQRALDLLEVQVRRRAAEMKNQPGPHRDAALAALKRAFDRVWADGERRLMADMLHTLGNIAQEPLAKEQLRQLEELARAEKPGTHDRLHIVWRQAQTLHFYGQAARAIDLLEQARRDAAGKVKLHPDEPLATLVELHRSLGHYARGETLLQDELKRSVPGEPQRWLIQQLLHLYREALANGAEVSVGKGQALYKALEKRLFEEISRSNEHHRYAMFNLLVKTYRTAQERTLDGVRDDVRAFAFTRFGELIVGQTNYYQAVTDTVVQLVRDVLGPADGVALILDRIESEPRWLLWQGQDTWLRHGHTLAHSRNAGPLPGDLEARLLKHVLAELRRDLELRASRTHALTHAHHVLWWSAKEAEFLKVAEAVLTERKHSHASVRFIAEYLYYGLRKHDRAIAVLLEAHRAGVLQREGVDQLVIYLHERERFAESIALLEPLVAKHLEVLNYRTRLMHAYFRTQQAEKLLVLLKQTDAFFHQQDRWNEDVLTALGRSTLENGLFAQSIAYYSELIPRYERSRSNRGIGDGVLSQHYANKARAHAGLKQTAEAVEAASGAIVAWGPRRDQRSHALENLVQIMTDAADLDAFVRHWDAKVEKEGQDSPIIRKALGQAFARKEQHAQAIPQLRLAAELQPNDTETHQLLVASFDKLKDGEGAIAQLLASVELSRREIKLFQDLGQRYQAAGNEREAERAFTSIVESLPNEAESHQLLAEIRQEQKRWPEAIPHWERVAQLRNLEPTGLLGLGKAQVHEKQWEKAKDTLKRLRGKSWPERFKELDKEIRELEAAIVKASGGR
jgi:tetratricopeptide (TPR) repeat protein